MSRTLANITTEVRGLIKDADDYVSDSELTSAINRAVTRLAEARPRKIVKEWTGDGSAKVFDLPDTFERGFSVITRVQYPFDATGETISEDVALARLTLIDTGTTFKLRLDFTPASGKKVRALFTAHHTLNGTSSTLPTAEDEDSVIHWAVAECLRIMAAKAIATGDVTIGADTVSYQMRSSQYKSLANYYSGISGLADIPALVYNRVAIVQADGEPYLTHA